MVKISNVFDVIVNKEDRIKFLIANVRGATVKVNLDSFFTWIHSSGKTYHRETTSRAFVVSGVAKHPCTNEHYMRLGDEFRITQDLSSGSQWLSVMLDGARLKVHPDEFLKAIDGTLTQPGTFVGQLLQSKNLIHVKSGK